MGDEPHPFGERLRQLREAASLTQEELGERAGLTGQAIGALETGKRRRPYPVTVRSIADALALSAAERSELAALASSRREPEPEQPVSELPLLPNSLVARAAELEAVDEALRTRRVRLLTLTGPGGVGKTRLALAAATSLSDTFTDGVAFVALAPISDPALLAATISQAVGIRQGSGRTAEESLRSHIRNRHLLLVLDNTEHLLPAAPEVAALLAACPNLSVLATSRAPLRIRGEHEYPVQPLDLPSLDRVPVPADVLSAPSAQLLVERAQAASPGFQISDANAAAVAAICRRLDGLPLALELAAPWLKVLTPTALLARLDRTLPLLTDGARDLPDRQQTMRNTIAWSYDLLDNSTQRLFRRMSVFVGGCTLEAVEEVSRVEGESETDLLPAIAELVDRSLLRQDDDRGSGPRFAMLETIREYGLEQLVASGEEEQTRSAHATWATNAAVQASATLDRRMEPDVLSLVSVEIANLREALSWLWQRRCGPELLRLSGAILWPWYLTGQLREGRQWAERALAVASDEPTPDRALATFAAGHLAHYLGDDDQAVARLQEASSMAGRIGVEQIEAFSTLILGVIAEDSGDYARARPLFESARDLYIRADHPRRSTLATFHLGVVAFGEGDSVRAVALQEEALTASREQGDLLMEAWCLEWLTLLAAERGDLSGAGDALARRLEIGGEAQSMPRDGQLVAAAAFLGNASGALLPAARLFGAVDTLLTTSGDSFRLPERLLYEEAVAHLRSSLGSIDFEAAAREGRALSDEAVTAEMRSILTIASTQPTPLSDSDFDDRTSSRKSKTHSAPREVAE